MLNIDPPYPRYKGLTLLTIGYTSKLWQGLNNYIRTSLPRPPPSWGQESSRCREIAVMVRLGCDVTRIFSGVQHFYL